MPHRRAVFRYVGPYITIEISLSHRYRDIVNGAFTADKPPRVAAIVEVRRDNHTLVIWGDAEDLPDKLLFLIQSRKIPSEAVFYDIVALSTLLEVDKHKNGNPSKRLSKEQAQAINRASAGHLTLDEMRIQPPPRPNPRSHRYA